MATAALRALDHRSGGAALALLALVALAYANAWQASFQFDDFNVIVNNPRVHSLAAWLEHASTIRPLLKLSYTLNWISGLGAIGFHGANIALHALNCFLLWQVMARLRFSPSNAATPSEATVWRGAWWCAALFATHPVFTEAVTYASGRSMSLLATFYLAAVWAHLASRDGSRWPRLAVPVLFLLACAVKEVAVTLPFALLLIELCRGASLKIALRRTVFVWVSLVVLGLGLALHSGYVALLSFGFERREYGAHLLSQIHALWYLTSRLVLIWRMDIDPDLRQFQHWDWPLAVQAIVLLALAGAAVAGLRRWPRFAFAVLWFLLHLAPTNSLIPRLDLANERHLYLATIGPLLLFGTWLVARWQLGVAVCCVLAACTYARNLDYRSEVALWHRTVATSPGNPRAHNNLGYAYELNGRLAEARFEYQHALALRPDYWRAEFNLRRVSARLRGQPAP